MKVAVTVTKTEQISMDDFKDCYYTKVFDEYATIGEINEWAQSISQHMTILSCRISEFVEPKASVFDQLAAITKP